MLSLFPFNFNYPNPIKESHWFNGNPFTKSSHTLLHTDYIYSNNSINSSSKNKSASHKSSHIFFPFSSLFFFLLLFFLNLSKFSFVHSILFSSYFVDVFLSLFSPYFLFFLFFFFFFFFFLTFNSLLPIWVFIVWSSKEKCLFRTRHYSSALESRFVQRQEVTGQSEFMKRAQLFWNVGFGDFVFWLADNLNFKIAYGLQKQLRLCQDVCIVHLSFPVWNIAAKWGNSFDEKKTIVSLLTQKTSLCVCAFAFVRACMCVCENPYV